MNQNLQNNPVSFEEDEINLGALLDSLWLDRKLVGLIAAAAFLLGTAYAFLAKPIYEANLIVQVEDRPGSTQSLLGEASTLFDTKTAASSEMEILRSRMVVARNRENRQTTQRYPTPHATLMTPYTVRISQLSRAWVTSL